jgi:hypothetical protein
MPLRLTFHGMIPTILFLDITIILDAMFVTLTGGGDFYKTLSLSMSKSHSAHLGRFVAHLTGAFSKQMAVLKLDPYTRIMEIQ